MKPSKALEHGAKFLIALSLLFACPLLMSAQTKDKKTTTPPPPPPKAAAPATSQKPQTGPTNPQPPKPQPPKPQPPKPQPPKPQPPRPDLARNPGVDRTEHPRPGLDVGRDHAGNAKIIHDGNRGITINHGLNGERRIETVRPDHSRIVTVGRHGGYVEHPFARGGHEYMRRTYVYGGRTYVSVYRGYTYRGVVYYRYVPAYYYRPAFYGWGYTPWGPHVAYTGWGWVGSPWYGWSGYYFSPYAVYPSAAFWLTDYMIAQNLQAAYDAQAVANTSAPDQAQAGQPQGNSPALSPEVKQMIAEEVKSQLAAEQAAAGQPSNSSGVPAATPGQAITTTDEVPPALDPNLQVFIVTTSLDVTANGHACSLSGGDVLMRLEDTPDKDNAVEVKVVGSQKSDCGRGSKPRIQVADLQEMHNHFREQMDNGLQVLADKQGKDGIPVGPAGTAVTNAEGRAAQDLTAATDLKKQQQDADQAEKEVQQASSSTSSGGGNN
jgi:hypothetical protein